MHKIDDDEPVSSGSKMSGEYSLDDRKIGNEKGKMGKKSPSKEPPLKASGKTAACKVYLLDGEGVDIHIDKNDTGKALFDKVCSHLDLIEQDYFGLTYTDDRGPGHAKVWLNLDKKVSKQMKRGAWVFEFALKFYPPDPCQLREYLTRWLVSLQIRRDLLSGKIPCTFTTYAILGSYSVQADIHDFDLATHGNHFDYIRDMTFAPNQTPELLEKIAELHRLHKGQEPHEADKHFLDNAKKLAMYGVDLHKAKDSDNIGVMVGVCCSGLLILRDKLRLNRFVWPKILKLSYKRNHFYIKIRPGEMERSETTIMFKLDNHRLAKRLWKTCVEHHAFFRLRESEKPENNLTFPRFGSKFRYSGRTLYENRNAPLVNRAPHNLTRPSPSKSGMKTTSGYSHSMDNVIHGSYDDGLYDPDGTNSEYAYGYKDGKDWKSQKGGSQTIAYAGTDADSWNALDEGGYKRRPSDSKFGGSKTSLPSQGESTLKREKAQGQDHYMGLTAGSIDGQEDPDSARERRRREKENDRKRREEAEEKRKRDQERKNKGLAASEDKIDQLGLGDATQSAYSGGPGSAFIQSGKDKFSPYGPPYGKDGYNQNGYDKDGYDRDGYDKDGYDRNNNDIKGRQKPYMAPFGKDGFNKNGYRPDGYDRDGFDKNAFDRDGYSKKGIQNPYGPPYDAYGFNENGYNKHGLDPDGFDKDGYDKNDVDKYGRKNPYAPPYDKDGYNEYGFDKHGFDRDGYDKDGFDKDGYDRLGRSNPYGPPYGRDGYNQHGFDRDGFDRDGFDKDGYSKDGTDRTEQLLALDARKGPMGLAMGKVDVTGVVGEEKTVENKVDFLPISNPVKGNKDSIKPFSDSTLPYFNPLSTSTVGRSKVPPPVPPKGSHALDNSFRSSRVDTENIQNNSSFPGISASSKNVPLVKTETRSVTYERDNSPYDLDDGELVSAHSHSSRLQTIETTTYKTEKNGMVETRVEQRFTVSLEDQDDFDYDSALADAIRSVIEFNPDMSVERIECVQHIEDDRNGK